MTDRELLELAAKVAEIRLDGLASRHIVQGVRENDYLRLNEQGGHSVWNPLEDDGDALRLTVKLHLDLITFTRHGATYAGTQNRTSVSYVDHDNDAYAATRRAIVRAAAAMATNSK